MSTFKAIRTSHAKSAVIIATFAGLAFAGGLIHLLDWLDLVEYAPFAATMSILAGILCCIMALYTVRTDTFTITTSSEID